MLVIVSSLHVWITVSSLANKDPNNQKALLFRQIELNWINAPLEDENDYIGLYLDSQPNDNTLPVSIHRLNGQSSGQIITDYYLPQIDFHNETNNIIRQYYGDEFEYGNSRDETNNNKLHRISNNDDINLFRIGISRETSEHLPQAKRNMNLLVDQCVGYCLAYHSRNKILAQNCLKTSPNWMHDSFQFIETRSLPSLMIPGSHNSGTYPKQLDKTVLHMINKYQMNQDECIFNQLIYGIRHLDLRVGYSKVKQRPERFWIYHDIFRTEISVSDVLKQVKRFLDLTSHEIIIMDFHRFTVGFQNENASTQKERHSKLIDLIFKQVGNYIVPSYLGQHAPLNEYVSMGKRLIIGYANKASILGSQVDQAYKLLNNPNKPPLRDIDSTAQQEESIDLSKENSTPIGQQTEQQQQQQSDRRVGTRIFNRLKSLKLISNSFSKRSIVGGSDVKRSESSLSSKLTSSLSNEDDLHETSSHDVSRASLFFSPVRHLWPNKDTIEGLAYYMNETTCRKYFGELRSMMVELTPTVFGAIADKYDGNRKLAQQVNRPITDWIRDRWLHCINIVASDFFLGNDLIRLAIHANKMRVVNRNDLNSNTIGTQCKSFRQVEHLLDKSKIPIQFSYARYHHQYAPQIQATINSTDFQNQSQNKKSFYHDIITHTSSDGNQILLKPLANSFNAQTGSRERRDSFVENVSDSLINLVSSFKRLLNF